VAGARDNSRVRFFIGVRDRMRRIPQGMSRAGPQDQERIAMGKPQATG